MIALSVAAAAGVICRSMENGERAPAGWAAALEAACMLQTPETAQRLMRAEQRRAELEAVLGTHRKDDQATIERLRASLREACDQVAALESDLGGATALVAELEARLAAKDRPVDEDPIAFVLTEKAADVASEANVTRSVRKLRNLLAGQRAEAGERP